MRTTPRPGDGASPPATNPAAIAQPADEDVVIEIARQTDADVVIRARGAHGTLTWTTPAGTQTTAADGEVVVPVAAGASVDVSAQEAVTTTTPVTEHCYFTFAAPAESVTLRPQALTTFCNNRSNTSQQPQIGQEGALRAPYFIDGVADRIARYPGATWRIDGFASYEGRPDRRAYNRQLSARRMAVLQQILLDAGATGVTLGDSDDHDPATIDARPNNGGGEWRRATAIAQVAATVTLTGSATLTRGAVPAPSTSTAVDPVPSAPGRPACFRKIGVRVRIEQDVFTRLEIYGEFDLETAAESRLPASSNSLPGNTADGIVSFLLGLKLAADRSSWEVRGEFRSDDADLDGLVRWADSDGDDTALNILGGVAIMAPLMAIATPPTADGADLVPMALIGATAGALGAARRAQDPLADPARRRARRRRHARRRRDTGWADTHDRHRAVRHRDRSSPSTPGSSRSIPPGR